MFMEEQHKKDMKERIAIIPGSFDPITNGHLNIIKRTAKMYDKIIVAVMINDQKKYMFKLSAREEMAKAAVAGMENVQVISSVGMLWQTAKTLNACAIVKGVRNAVDLEYEKKMAEYNSEYYPEAETIFLPADDTLTDVNSTAVRELIKQNKDFSSIVPIPVAELIESYLSQTQIINIDNYFEHIPITYYNKKIHPALNKAESFISNMDHALEKSDENARMQCRVIGWDEDTKALLKLLINNYREEIKLHLD